MDNMDFLTAQQKQEIQDAHRQLRAVHSYLQTVKKAGIPVDEHIAQVEELQKLAQGMIRLWVTPARRGM